MLWSKNFIPTLREVPQEAESVSHQLMLRAGLIRMLSAGIYSYLPLGFKALGNIQAIIRQEMDMLGAAELLLPALQPQELWQRSCRDKDMGEVMIKFTDRRGRNLCLGPTHEEVITDLVGRHISSYRMLPLLLYQIQTKFRDEIRPRFGLIRACEFIMKDAYSFDKDEDGLSRNYGAMFNAYKRIFKRCGLRFLIHEADPGVMGGNASHEFMVPAQDGEEWIALCPVCKSTKPWEEGKDNACPKCAAKPEKVSGIEVGHIFKLGTKYSSALDAHFIDSSGRQRPIVMGCYGIGVSRLLPAIIEQNHDARGISWPEEISPCRVIILPLDITDAKIRKESWAVYEELKARYGIVALLDDRDERAGVKFNDADLLGITLQIIIGKESLKKNKIELKIRRSQEKVVKTKAGILREVKRIIEASKGG